MDISEFQNMFKAEDGHWWFKGKRAIIKYLLKDNVKTDSKILDFGCGCGATLASFKNVIHAEGVDVSEKAFQRKQ
ncbi:hypothetical protein KJ840_04490 [Patescibacteria group bacterium]|nr:hypothetical protein [Patescibacteria group bacterium]